MWTYRKISGVLHVVYLFKRNCVDSLWSLNICFNYIVYSAQRAPISNYPVPGRQSMASRRNLPSQRSSPKMLKSPRCRCQLSCQTKNGRVHARRASDLGVADVIRNMTSYETSAQSCSASFRPGWRDHARLPLDLGAAFMLGFP